MQTGQKFWQSQGIGVKLATINFLLVTAILTLLVMGIAWGVTQSIHEKQQSEMTQGIAMMAEFIEASDQDLRKRTTFLADRFASSLAGHLALDEQSNPPSLMLDGNALNSDNARMEAFTESSGAIATLFVKHGDGYMRIATSLKNEQGQPAIGTLLDSNHPAVAAIHAGQAYTGLVTLFGRQYMTQYRPLKDVQGRIIGLTFVGQDFSELLNNLKHSIQQLKIGGEGYYFVLNADKGPAYGELVVHPSQSGKNILSSKDEDGNLFIQEMLDRKNGAMTYSWLNPGENFARQKTAVFSHYAPWGWVFASSAYLDEFAAQTRGLIWAFIGMGLVAVLLLAGLWLVLIRRMIVQPLTEASHMAKALAQGDLTHQLRNERQDEIGQLLDAMNHTAQGLSRVVHTVQARSESVAMASTEIAQGNIDLASRTESAASALEETAAAMEELGSTVAQNADHAKTANQLTQIAQRVVTEGGDAVRQVVQTMQGIDASSQKIADIIGVIDGIAFQTNILALNAAVEAARAGEHGRGFAVVAGEVRQLAQRSAEAAKEIKQLISTSVDEIQQGNIRAARAGETMEQAVSEIQKVTNLIADISHASLEQSNGVAQVGEAVTNMDQTTQQNAALVEEMAASADSLRQQSEELLRAMSIFKLTTESTEVSTAPSPVAHKASTLTKNRGASLVQPKTSNLSAPETDRPASLVAPSRKLEPSSASKNIVKEHAYSTDKDDWENF